MFTALASLFANRKVNKDIAMTGEVTLRGRVLPVGGVREKALAALRSGVTTIVIPESNVGDLREIPKQLKKRITFIPVKHMREVLDVVLVSQLDWKPKAKRVAITTAAPQGIMPIHARADRD